MTVQVFHPAPVDQSATNWAVAARIVGAFAPRAQTTPGMTVALDAGALFIGATLIEVPAQSTTAIAAPAANPRIDRVVVDAATGAVSVITGTEAATPAAPAIPYGKLPVARVALSPGMTAIVNELITDERVPAGPISGSAVVCRATLGGVNQTGIPANTWTRVNFSATDFNIGGGFDAANHRFQPTTAGYYQLFAMADMQVAAGMTLQLSFQKNGTRSPIMNYYAGNQSFLMGTVADIVFLNGSTDYVEFVISTNNTGPNTLVGAPDRTFFTAQRIG